MYLKHAQFDHEQSNINLALGLSKQQEITIRERIVFHVLAHHLNIIHNYEDVDDAPKEERTTSGVLQKLLGTIHSELEYEMTLFAFSKVESVCDQLMSLYFQAHNAKADIAMKLVIAKLQAASIEMEAKTDDKEKMVMSPINLFNRIEQVKASNGNFDEYMRRYAAMKLEPVHTDVDAILNGVFTFD